MKTIKSRIQRIDDLKKLINYNKIKKEKIVTFCSDVFDQVLYIFDPKYAGIQMIQMRDHHTEEVFDYYDRDLARSQLFSQNNKDGKLFTKAYMDIDSKPMLGRKSATRQKRMTNQLVTKSKNE